MADGQPHQRISVCDFDSSGPKAVATLSGPVRAGEEEAQGIQPQHARPAFRVATAVFGWRASRLLAQAWTPESDSREAKSAADLTDKGDIGF